jgi:hypothetical protein
VHIDISDMTEVIDRMELTDEEQAAGETLPQVDQIRDGELAPIKAAADAVYAAVRLTSPEGDGCSAVAPRPAAEDAATGGAFGGALGDGRTFQVRFDDQGLPQVWLDGEQVSSAEVTPDGEVTVVGGGWLATDDDGDRGLAYGVRPPGSVRTYAVTGDGVEVCAGIVYADDDRWFALPDVSRQWSIVHEIPDADVIEEDLATREEALEEEIQAAADARQEELDACAEEPEACMPPPGVTAWEGPIGDGRTYRVELDEDDTRVLIDGIEIGEAEDATPSWTDPMRSFGLSFSGDFVRTDPAVLVGAVPPGAVESLVLDEDGQPVVTPSLTFSPDGRYYAIWTGDTVGPTEGVSRPVRHRAADGTLFPLGPDHDAARGIPETSGHED